MIHIIRTRATKAQIDEMLETLSVYINLAVDIREQVAQIVQNLLGGV